MRYIDTWLNGLGLEYIIPKLKDHGITTPKQLATLSLREIYEVVGVEDSDDRKKLYFLIQRLQTYKPPAEAGVAVTQEDGISTSSPDRVQSETHVEEEDIRVLRKNRRVSTVHNTDDATIDIHATLDPPRSSTGSEISRLLPPHPPPLPSSSNQQQSSFIIEDMPIRVVIRKRPLSRSELSKGDRDVLEIRQNGIVLVHEPKTKVDLTRVVETQTFIFDDAFDSNEPNELIYHRTVKPLVDFIFTGGKATCFAYGQTGSGKTFSMMGCCPEDPSRVSMNAGLYVLAARDIFEIVQRKPNLKVVVSCFEIYGTKLFDLLNGRNAVKCLEDSKQQVQIPGLTEHVAQSVDELLEMMRVAHTHRSTGSTGANSESSRSHQILQLQLKDISKKKNDVERKLSFIDLAGSERGADTVHSSKQTRQEGAEINTSLLALKEVIRSLEKKHGHTPFRGSKLTQVLKDSFVGARTRTCMLACVSPSQFNCEHTLNTLRYADRVKEHQVGQSSGVQQTVETSFVNIMDSSFKLESKQVQHSRTESATRQRKSPSKVNGQDGDKEKKDSMISESGEIRRRSISQPAGSLTKRNTEIEQPTPKTNKAIGKPTGGAVANRVTEKLKDMNESSTLSSSQGSNNLTSPPKADLSSTRTIQKILDLLSAHKISIAAMVEVMKDEMELVQGMENVEDRNTIDYVERLENILTTKRNAIGNLRSELKSFQKFRLTSK